MERTVFLEALTAMTYYLGTCKEDDGGIFVVTVVILLVILAVLGIILQRTYFEYIYFEKMYEEILEKSDEIVGNYTSFGHLFSYCS